MSKGRGRGRGQGMTFNIEAIGFRRGDALPTSLLQPPPKYPPLKKRPVPLISGDDQNYLLEVEKEFEKTMKSSPYYIKQEEEKNSIERYSDRYRTSTYSDNTLSWEPDWTRFPAELRIEVRKKKKPAKKVAPNLAKLSRKRGAIVDHEDVKKKLEDLEKKDTENPEANAEKTKAKEEPKESENESEVEEFDDEEEEEENDYLTSYFDNGESYLDEEEDNLDEKEGGIY